MSIRCYREKSSKIRAVFVSNQKIPTGIKCHLFVHTTCKVSADGITCPNQAAAGTEWAVMDWRRRLCLAPLVIALLVCVGIFWYRAKRKEHPYTDAVLAAEEFSGGEGDGGYPLSED